MTGSCHATASRNNGTLSEPTSSDKRWRDRTLPLSAGFDARAAGGALTPRLADPLPLSFTVGQRAPPTPQADRPVRGNKHFTALPSMRGLRTSNTGPNGSKGGDTFNKEVVP